MGDKKNDCHNTSTNQKDDINSLQEEVKQLKKQNKLLMDQIFLYSNLIPQREGCSVKPSFKIKGTPREL